MFLPSFNSVKACVSAWEIESAFIAGIITQGEYTDMLGYWLALREGAGHDSLR